VVEVHEPEPEAAVYLLVVSATLSRSLIPEVAVTVRGRDFTSELTTNLTIVAEVARPDEGTATSYGVAIDPTSLPRETVPVTRMLLAPALVVYCTGRAVAGATPTSADRASADAEATAISFLDI
jgi:hypothetical protein